MELEWGPFEDVVTDSYMNDLREPEATGIIQNREFIILATMYYTFFCSLGGFDAANRPRELLMRWIRGSAFVHERKKGSRGMRRRLERGVKKVGVCKRKEKRRNGNVNRNQDKSSAFN